MWVHEIYLCNFTKTIPSFKDLKDLFKSLHSVLHPHDDGLNVIYQKIRLTSFSEDFLIDVSRVMLKNIVSRKQLERILSFQLS